MSDKHAGGHRFTLAVAAATGLLMAMPTALAGPAASASTPMVISVLSTRADLVSGDEALVAITLPSGATNSAVRITLNGQVVTSAFTVRSGQVLEGLVNNLALGPNVLAAQLPSGSGAQITITNHPNGGPVLSGPQLQPWTCEPGAADAQCDRPAQYTYVYKSSDPTKSGFQPYDPAHPGLDQHGAHFAHALAKAVEGDPGHSHAAHPTDFLQREHDQQNQDEAHPRGGRGPRHCRSARPRRTPARTAAARAPPGTAANRPRRSVASRWLSRRRAPP